jgi:hypothetical protein
MRYSQASRCGTPLLSTVFDFKVRPGTGVQPQSLIRILASAIFFIQLYSAIAVLATCPRTQGYRKETLFHTKRRSGRDRESNPGHLLGRHAASLDAEPSTAPWDSDSLSPNLWVIF